MGLVIEAARAYERELELADRYQELDRLKTEFIAITSHELRSPLTAVIGFAETLMRSERLCPDQLDLVHEGLLRQARRLKRLVEDLQTVSRIDAGTLPVHIERVRLRQVLAGAAEACGLREDVRLEGDEEVMVLADEDRLIQVMTNLFTNAATHGEVPISVTWRSSDGRVVVHIRDEGPGVPVERRERIFERFAQGGDVLAHHEGTDLGLSIARELARAMNGELVLADVEGPGAEFIVRLSLA